MFKGMNAARDMKDHIFYVSTSRGQDTDSETAEKTHG